MIRLNRTWLLRIAIIVVIGGAALLGWRALRPKGPGSTLASGNGRIEAVEIDIAAKIAGRVQSILVNEGDFVTPGQVVAHMDTAVLDAQRREAEAQLRQAETAVATAESQVAQRESERAAAVALVAQREAELNVIRKRLARFETLAAQGIVPPQDLDDARASAQSAQAAISAARAQVAAAEAAIATARSRVIESRSNIDAARATIERLQADIDDSALKAPRDGRVQYRVAQLGEVLSAGGIVLNMIDLSDVHMTFFLPETVAGRVAIGSDVHLVLDAVPQYVIPAKVSFVADVAQFTPKAVETASERQKLMFRVKAQIAPELLKRHIRRVKTGLPGVAYVRLDPRVEWPANLQVKIPE